MNVLQEAATAFATLAGWLFHRAQNGVEVRCIHGLVASLLEKRDRTLD